MKKLLARFVYWLTGWLPLPEIWTQSPSEWAYAVLHPKPSLDAIMRDHYRIEREREYMTPEARWLTRQRGE